MAVYPSDADIRSAVVVVLIDHNRPGWDRVINTRTSDPKMRTLPLLQIEVNSRNPEELDAMIARIKALRDG